jgi:hypothetical protein
MTSRPWVFPPGEYLTEPAPRRARLPQLSLRLPFNLHTEPEAGQVWSHRFTGLDEGRVIRLTEVTISRVSYEVITPGAHRRNHRPTGRMARHVLQASYTLDGAS